MCFFWNRKPLQRPWQKHKSNWSESEQRIQRNSGESLKFQDALRALDEQEEKERLEAEKRQRSPQSWGWQCQEMDDLLCAKSCTSLEIKTCHELEPTSEGPQKSTRQRGWFCAGISVQDRFLLDERASICTRVETMQDARYQIQKNW